jgi:hypothetical protein
MKLHLFAILTLIGVLPMFAVENVKSSVTSDWFNAANELGPGATPRTSPKYSRAPRRSGRPGSSRSMIRRWLSLRSKVETPRVLLSASSSVESSYPQSMA